MKEKIDNYIARAAAAIADLKDSMPISGSSLWNESKSQCLLEGKASELKVDGIDMLKTFKRMIDRYKCGLKSKIRQNPESYNIDKITKDAVDDVMMCDSKVIALENSYDELEHSVELIKAIYDQLMSRKSMLRDMISMYTSAYWRDSLGSERNQILECMLQDVTGRLKRQRNER